MTAKKNADVQLSPEEADQVESIHTNYPTIATQLHESQDQAQVEAALKEIFALSEAAQLALIKSLAKTNRADAADILVAINAVSTHKEVRKEARRGLLRLEGSKVTPHWTAPVVQAPAVQMSVSNPPRFWKGFATQSREQGEVQVTLCWEEGYEYGEARIVSFLLDFWNDGVKDFFYETGTKRHVDEHIKSIQKLASEVELVPCSLGEAKQLIEEALEINAWRQTQPHPDYRAQLPLLNKLIFQAPETGTDTGQTLITPEMEPQEVAVNFIGAWSFGDYGLAYDLLATNSPVRDNLTRDEWIQQHRAWFDEAHPTRMELNFVHEREQQQNAIWLPNAAASQRATTTKQLEVGWSLELVETPLSGTIKEMPMGTAVNKETGRHWFWNNYTLTKENNTWRIQQIKDEGVALQGVAVDQLQKRIKEYEDVIEQGIKQQEKDPEAFMEEMSWRLGQMLHFHDALIAQLPLDYNANEDAYGCSVLTGNPERMMVYLERLIQRFPNRKADTLRRLGATLAELAFKFDRPELKERHQHLLQRAEENLRESVVVDDSATSHSLLGELLMSLKRNEDAREEFRKSLELLSKGSKDPNLEASIEAGLGNVAMRLQQTEEAIPHYQRVAEIQPQYPGVWFSLGFANRLLGRLDEAEPYYQRALAEDSTDIRIYSELTAIYIQRSDSNKAQMLLEGALRQYPETAYLHALLASVLAEKGDRRQAQRHLEEAERIDPESDFIPAVRQQIANTRKRV
ncbi:tetratricopeptide repeat protein [Dictyobacter formicarum]|uniref:Tetratricopeptide repeat protein n=1 Tax=Dictyobacter formicarum TaxID=2778368 RepID=A0ABQ3VFP5_9CHLR|nr:tetratricopeptide repeat protein [Dictyobacter formicarum]GHO84643.1 hypothetical protein KSZ_26490 [Dictyobacter formicarum]